MPSPPPRPSRRHAAAEARASAASAEAADDARWRVSGEPPLRAAPCRCSGDDAAARDAADDGGGVLLSTIDESAEEDREPADRSRRCPRDAAEAPLPLPWRLP